MEEEAFELKDDRLAREERARYGEHNAGGFSTLYYPQSRYDYSAVGIRDASRMDFAVLESPDCSRCQKSVHYSTFRRVRGDSEFCVECLKKMGCCILPGSEHTLVPDLVAMIMSFLPEYYHVTRAARVSRAWLSCFNYDHTHESDMMILKRIWISREIFFRSRAVLSTSAHARYLAFVARFDLGAFLGEWIDGTFKTQFGWLRLCSSIVESDFYKNEFRFVTSRPNCIPAYTHEDGMCVMSLPAKSNSKSQKYNVYRIPDALKKGGSLATVLGDADAVFSATVQTQDGKAIDIQLDIATGVIVGPPTEFVSKRKGWLRCMFC